MGKVLVQKWESIPTLSRETLDATKVAIVDGTTAVENARAASGRKQFPLFRREIRGIIMSKFDFPLFHLPPKIRRRRRLFPSPSESSPA